MEHILEKLFESTPKARILRMFVRNVDEHHVFPDIIRRTGLKPKVARHEMSKLQKIGLLRTDIKNRTHEITPRLKNRKSKKKRITRKERVYFVNESFPALSELRNFIVKCTVASKKKLLSQIRNLGNIKLAVISGIFLNNEDARTDLLIVGDNVKKRRFNSFLDTLESDLGKSVRCTLMDGKEFAYRMNMYDRFLRDVFEHPHEKLIARVRI